jgi:hypothetical protein
LAASIIACYSPDSRLGRAFGADADSPPPTPSEEQPEVMTRGPVHEAFAQPVDTQVRQDAVVAPNEPPPLIEETPPDERPAGAQVVWVSGYWAWDADRHNHIWVSGCWRTAPPRMSWIPGYWMRTGAGWEWVPGFWTAAGVEEIEYLPPPPEFADYGPPGPSPTADTIWVPPCYYWVDGAYVARNGYWHRAEAGWAWVPSHYIRTPHGHVFIAGCWDYPLERRGVLFAPVAFSPGVRVRVFSPTIVIDTDVLTVNLFARPSYHHYYFGDYYDDTYISIGIFPWLDVERRHGWYDPCFEYERWNHRRSEPQWEDRVRRDFVDRREHRDLRPAKTFREMEAKVAAAPEKDRRTLEVAKPLAKVVASKTTTVKFEHVTADTRQRIVQQTAETAKFRTERTKWEATPAAKVQPSTTPRTKEEPVTAKERKDQPDVKRPVEPAVPERKVPSPKPVENKPEVEQPREKPLPAERPTKPQDDGGKGKPDRVKIPSRPIRDQSGADDKAGPPARPGDEDKRRVDPGDSRPDDNRGKDNKPNEAKGKDDNKGKGGDRGGK